MNSAANCRLQTAGSACATETLPGSRHTATCPMEKHGMSATASLGKDTLFTAPHIQNSDRRVEKGVYLCLSSLPAPPFHATEQALNTIRANQLPIRAALRELAFRMDDSAVTEAVRVLVHPLIHGGTVREHCRSCQNVLLNDPSASPCWG